MRHLSLQVWPPCVRPNGGSGNPAQGLLGRRRLEFANTEKANISKPASKDVHLGETRLVGRSAGPTRSTYTLSLCLPFPCPFGPRSSQAALSEGCRPTTAGKSGGMSLPTVPLLLRLRQLSPSRADTSYARLRFPQRFSSLAGPFRQRIGSGPLGGKKSLGEETRKPLHEKWPDCGGARQ